MCCTSSVVRLPNLYHKVDTVTVDVKNIKQIAEIRTEDTREN